MNHIFFTCNLLTEMFVKEYVTLMAGDVDVMVMHRESALLNDMSFRSNVM